MSEGIEAKRTILGEKAFRLEQGEAAEQLTDKLFDKRSFTIEQVRKGFAMVREADPQFAGNLTAEGLEGILERAEGEHALAAFGATVSPAKLATQLSNKKVWAKIEAALGKDSRAIKELDDILSVSRILADPGFTPGSRTAPLGKMFEHLQNLRLITPSGAFEAYAKTFQPAKFAKALNTPDGRDALLKLGKIRPSKAGAIVQSTGRLFGQLVGIVAREEFLEGREPEEAVAAGFAAQDLISEIRGQPGFGGGRR
jgi:hypothetical protein